MKDKRDIFTLISSLNKSEKRYFKLNANLYNKGKTNKYIQLFDFINKKNISEDFALSERFKHSFTANQLAVTKNYLYKMLLSSMSDFHKKQNNTKSELVLQIDFLLKKGLVSQAEKLIVVANKEIEKTNSLANKLEILDLELEISNYKPELLSLEKLDSFHSEQKTILAQQELLVFYKHLFYKKNILEQKADNENIVHYRIAFEGIYLESKSKANSKYHTYYSKYYLHLTNKHCSIQLNKLEDFHTHGKLLISHLTNNPKATKQEPEKLVWAYYSYIYSLLLLKKKSKVLDKAFDEFDNMIEKDLSTNKSATVLAKMVYYFFVLKRNVSFEDNQIEEKLITTFISENEALIPLRFKMMLEYLLAYHFFNNKQFDKSVQFLHKTIYLYNQKTGVGKDVFIISKLLLAINYNELEEVDLLTNSLQSVYYYLYKTESKKVFESKLLLLIKTLLKTKLNYNVLNEQIDLLNEDESLNPIMELFDFDKFVSSRNLVS